MSVQQHLVSLQTVAKLCDYLTGRPVLRTPCVQYLIAFWSRPEETRFVMPVVPDSRVKFGYPRLNLSREIHLQPPEAAFSTVFRGNFWPEVGIGVMSGAVVDPTGTKGRVQFGDSRSNRSRDIRLPHLVTNDDAGHHIRAKELYLKFEQNSTVSAIFISNSIHQKTAATIMTWLASDKIWRAQQTI